MSQDDRAACDTKLGSLTSDGSENLVFEDLVKNFLTQFKGLVHPIIYLNTLKVSKIETLLSFF